MPQRNARPPLCWSPFEPVDSDAKLEAEILLVRDVRRVDEIGVAHRHRLDHGAECRARAGGLLDRLPLHGHFVERHLGILLPRIPVEAASDELVAIRIDEVARDVLAQRRRRRTGQAKRHGTQLPKRDVRPANHRADFQAVAGQESLRGEHAERVEVVVAFCSVAASIRRLDLLDEPVAAPEERILLRCQRAASLALPVQPDDLIHRPPKPPPQTGHDTFQFVDKALHMPAQ